MKLLRLGLSRAGHAGELGIKAEVILNGDRGQGLGFAFDRHTFLGFDGLMQTIAPATPGHEAPGVFIDDDHLVFLDDVLDVFLIEAIGLEQLRDGVDLLGFVLEVALDLGLQL